LLQNLKSVEEDYIDQHEVYYLDNDYQNVQNIEINAFSWFSYSCLEDHDFEEDQYRENASCPIFSKSNDWLEIKKNEVFHNPLYFVFPNPNMGYFKIKLSEPIHKATKSYIKITNSIGETVYENTLNKTTTDINLSNKPSGVYIVEILISNNKYINKVIINK